MSKALLANKRRLGVVIVLLCVVFLGGCKSRPTPTSVPTPVVVSAPSSLSGTLKVVVARTGIYRLPAELLMAAGMDPAVWQAGKLSLSLDGKQVPMWIDNDRTALYFYGRQSPSRYTEKSTYLLMWGAETGLMMQEEALSPPAGEKLSTVLNTLHLEENREYIARAITAVDEPWFWDRFSPDSSIENSFDLPALADGPGQIHMSVWGATTDSQVEPDHRLSLTLNGQVLGNVDWDGETVITGTLAIPAGTLQLSQNQLLIHAPGDTGNLIDLSLLDWIKIDFPVPAELRDGMLVLLNISGDLEIPNAQHLFDVTDTNAPVYLASDGGGANLGKTRSVVALDQDGGLTPLQISPLSSVKLASESYQADYLILAPQELVSAVQPLAEARQAQGLAVQVVSLNDVAEGFGVGTPTPLAINAFLRHVFEHWSSPQPRFLLLVGEATYDFKDYLNLMPAHVVPPMLVPVSYGGETISDTRLADVDDDERPDLAVGRWPVTNANEVAALVQRTLAYEAASETSSNAIFVADNSESSFPNMSDRLLDAAGLTDAAHQLYGASGEETIQTWNQGAWLVNYVGHGSLNLWGRTEMLSREGVAGLQAVERPPIVTQFTCLTGFFAHPQQSSLAEEMLWSENGPVAIVAATSLTLASNQETFASLLLQAINDPQVRTIGDALFRTQQSPEMNYSGAQEIIDTFNLLGDPALVIARP